MRRSPNKIRLLATALAAVCLAGSQAHSEETDTDIRADIHDDLFALCESIMCRSPGQLRFMNDDGTWSVIDISAPLPYVQNEMVTIMPGETLYIEAEIYDDRLRYMTAVPEVRHPETTLVLKFEIKAENQWWLTLENPFPETIKYHAQMMLPDGADTYETSSCPIKSGIPVIEMWPHAIFQLILFDFRVVDSNSEEAGLCVY